MNQKRQTEEMRGYLLSSLRQGEPTRFACVGYALCLHRGDPEATIGALHRLRLWASAAQDDKTSPYRVREAWRAVWFAAEGATDAVKVTHGLYPWST